MRNVLLIATLIAVMDAWIFGRMAAGREGADMLIFAQIMAGFAALFCLAGWAGLTLHVRRVKAAVLA